MRKTKVKLARPYRGIERILLSNKRGFPKWRENKRNAVFLEPHISHDTRENIPTGKRKKDAPRGVRCPPFPNGSPYREVARTVSSYLSQLLKAFTDSHAHEVGDGV